MKQVNTTIGTRKRSRVAAIGAALIALVFLVAACGAPTGMDGVSLVDIDLRVPDAQELAPVAGARQITDPSVPQNVLIQVTAEDMETIEELVTRDSTDTERSFVRLEVPAGPARTFTVQVRTIEDEVLFSGSRTVDLARGSTIRIRIRLVRLPSGNVEFEITGLEDIEDVAIPVNVTPDATDDSIVRLEVPTGTDVRSIAPVFTVSDGATVSAVHYPATSGGQIFVGPDSEASVETVDSAETSLSFAAPIEFTITAEDGETTRTVTAYTYYADARSGQTGAAAAGIYVQNRNASEIVLLDDLVAGQGVFERQTDTELTASFLSPQDIDFDAAGSTYAAGSSSIWKFENHLSTYTAGGGLEAYLTESLDFIAADRVRDRLYFTASGVPELYYLESISGLNTQFMDAAPFIDVTTIPNNSSLLLSDIEGTDAFPSAGLLGVAVDEAGYVYVVTEASDFVNYTLLKIDPVAPAIVDGIDLDAAGIDFITGYGATGNDLLYREGSLYLLNDVAGGDPSAPAVFEFSTNPLALADSIGILTTDETDTTPGSFLGPTRFAAVLNKRIIIIDESGSGDRTTFFTGIDGGSPVDWGIYGGYGYGTDQFLFFSGS